MPAACQLVECAIDTIADVSYANASMARIAKRAGISRGLISCHSAGKDELIAQVIITVDGEGAALMIPRIEAESTAAGQFRACIESNLADMGAHPERMVATVETVASGVLATGLPGIDPAAGDREQTAAVEAARRPARSLHPCAGRGRYPAARCRRGPAEPPRLRRPTRRSEAVLSLLRSGRYPFLSAGSTT